MLNTISGDWERVSIILTPSHIVVAQDFFQWLFTSKEKELQIKYLEKIEKLESLVKLLVTKLQLVHKLCFQAVYQTWPERTKLEFSEDLILRLKFETEGGVQEMVSSIREAWEVARGVKLEVIFK